MRWLPLTHHKFIQFVAILVAISSGSAWTYAATVDIYPGDNIPSVVSASAAGTTFVIHPGTYRLNTAIVPKNGDSFVGQAACAPPKTACSAIISGSRVIGGLAKLKGQNYAVTGQGQQGAIYVTTTQCEPGWAGCLYPEDLFFDGAPLKHVHSASLPALAAGQWWFDYANDTIYFHDNPAGHVVETSVAPSAFTGTANNVTIRQLTIKGFAVPLSGGAVGMAIGKTSTTQGVNWKIQNCEILLNHGAGVRMNFGMQILNNYIHDNGQLGIGGGTVSTSPSRIVIAGNTINYNNYSRALPAYGSGGIKINYTQGIVIRGNTVSYNDGAGIHFDMSNRSPLVDNNTVTDNVGGAGIQYEISLASGTFRNNRSLRNGLPDSAGISSSGVGIGSFASSGIATYCNVIQVPKGKVFGMTVTASNRGSDSHAPHQYLVSTGNSFHHNTVIWDEGATGPVAYRQLDVAHQPNFFAQNAAPNFNWYHMPSLSARTFVYDNNNTQANSPKTFAQFQSAGADVNGTADTKYKSGYPTVTITSPADGSSFTNSVQVVSAASDKSGISKVEFYVDWKLQTSVTTSPYSFFYTNGTAGSHVVTALAYSKAGIRNCYAVTLTKE